jgi:FtsP/CotA-like multicopper oxidase with cupredoxin domain
VDAVGASTQDRIFVLERWNGTARTAINGKSWPYTERLTYKVGETARWRFVNASDQNHPMHLHGGEFQLDAVGNGEVYKAYASAAGPREFTHSVEIGETFDINWTPIEAGNWLFHCHRLAHMRLPIELEPADVVGGGSHQFAHDVGSDYAGMGGMILGITVTGGSIFDTQSPEWKPQRQLSLTVASQNGDPRFYQLSLKDLAPGAASTKPLESVGLAGPVMVLNQNQSVEVALVNKLKEPMTIHWHGIELESYYDGVPMWGGTGTKLTPAVLPGQTFGVHMTPARAGTFMYHTHWHDTQQINGGVYGMLVVVPAGEKYNADTDKAFVVTQSTTEPFGSVMTLMNGAPQLPTMTLKTGTTYRLRFGNLTPGINDLRVSLRDAGTAVQWRFVSKDAFGVAGTPMQVADQKVSIGETFDFEFVATTGRTLTLEALAPNTNQRAVQTLVFANP